MAKGMGDGFPVGAMAAKDDIADSLKPGDHGTTFGGNPLACSAVLGVIEAINKDNLIEKSEKDGRYFKEKLMRLKEDVDFIEEVRGKGMMIGLSLNKDANVLVSSVLNKGALINATSDSVIRLVPSFVITKDEIDRVVSYIAD
jgi:acetylornithine/succinyldiaminopimelate/putrescine aminotransferase